LKIILYALLNYFSNSTGSLKVLENCIDFVTPRIVDILGVSLSIFEL
jgi:hypothetical protein